LKVEGGGSLGKSEKIGFANDETSDRRTAEMKRTKKNHQSANVPFSVMSKQDPDGLKACFAENSQLLLPLLDLVQNTRTSIDELMHDAGRSLVEQLLVLSAMEIAGDKHPGKQRGDVRWHGTQRGQIVMDERKLNVQRPRLRNKAGGEVAIPAYEQLSQNPRLGQRVRDIMVTGVSTRKYAKVLPEMAGTVGISKSSISREFIKASEKALSELMGRHFDDKDILAIYMDGIIVDKRHILAAIGVDNGGGKHLMGLASGSSENAEVVKDLLRGLTERGLSTEREYLFVIDGSKALRSAIEAIFGERAHVQRCRTHKVRNVIERLPREVASQVAAVMKAAYKLPEKDGLAKLKTQAAWLKTQYPDASASLLEGLEETFTVNRLGLTPALMRCLSTTNIIENPNGAVRRVTRRVTRYRDADMAMRWTAAGFLEAEKHFRKISGANDLWILAAALHRSTEKVVDHDLKSA
jgi:putative transposase